MPRITSNFGEKKTMKITQKIGINMSIVSDPANDPFELALGTTPYFWHKHATIFGFLDKHATVMFYVSETA
jgi:hypothetical protein